MFYQIIKLIKVFFSWEQNPVVTVSAALLDSKGLLFLSPDWANELQGWGTIPCPSRDVTLGNVLSTC